MLGESVQPREETILTELGSDLQMDHKVLLGTVIIDIAQYHNYIGIEKYNESIACTFLSVWLPEMH